MTGYSYDLSDELRKCLESLKTMLSLVSRQADEDISIDPISISRAGEDIAIHGLNILDAVDNQILQMEKYIRAVETDSVS
jgi:hypothetical protein